MSTNRTWIRVEDDFGQFDHDKARPVRPGIRVVDGYPEHVSPWARPAKPFTDKAGQPTDKTGDAEPPRTGTGSGRDAWAAYADLRGVVYPDDATRDQLIDLIDEDRLTR